MVAIECENPILECAEQGFALARPSTISIAEGKGGGEYYTARCVVKLLVEMIEPFKGVYDPRCGSGGMFVQSGGGPACLVSSEDVAANSPSAARACANLLRRFAIDKITQ